VFSLLLKCGAEEMEGLSGEIWELGADGAAEEEGGMRVFFGDDSRAAEVTSKLASYSPEWRAEAEIDYEGRVRASFPGIEIGSKFFLAPPWSEEPTPAGRLRLVVEPGMACGTGWHPCTQLCLKAMEELVSPGSSFLDVGCGSGILSEAARLLGAGRIAACDVDEEAAGIAREKFGIDVFVGTIEAVKEGSFDVIVANISAEVAGAIAGRAARVARAVILSGFAEWEAPAVPFEAKLRRGGEGWCAVVG
jgi:ribosomal protein L11 methyltransferase